MNTRRMLPLFALGLLALAISVGSRAAAQPQQKKDEDKLAAANLKTDGPALLEFFKRRTLSKEEHAKYSALIKEMGAPQFKTREQAAAQVEERGPVLLSLLQAQLKGDEAEVARRCERIIAKLRASDVAVDVPPAAARLLANSKPPGTAEVLEAFLPFADNAALRTEVQKTLAAVGKKGDAIKPQEKVDEERLDQAKIKTDGPALLDFFKQRTLSDAERAKYQAIIKDLGASAFKTREQATGLLVARGPVLLNVLKENLTGEDVEVVRRCEKIIARLREIDVPADVPPAAARLLAARKPAGAAEVLLAYLPFADNDAIHEEVRNTLAAIAVREGTTEPVFAAALTDKNAQRRAAAAEALARSGAADQKAAVKKLLADPEPLVRFYVGSALAYGKERDAVPVLIDLLPTLPQNQAWQVEDMLYRLAEDHKAPQIPLGSEEADRKKASDAWAAWWKETGNKVDLAKLSTTPKLLNYTLLVLLDMGRVLEVNNAEGNKVRWQVDNLIFPLDVQLLPNDRLLVAEYHAARVTERDIKTGEVKWQYRVNNPLVAQRLPNGNTFFVTDYQLLEIDAKENKVFQHSLENDEKIMKAIKLPNGQAVCLTNGARVVRIDEKGKEVSTFNVDLGTRLFGGRLHVLPNGRLLVPHNGENKVVEYDANGKVVWEVSIPQPVAASRLPNGNTLVTTMTQDRAVEFDRNGREVWEYKTDTRVTRAIRR